MFGWVHALLRTGSETTKANVEFEMDNRMSEDRIRFVLSGVIIIPEHKVLSLLLIRKIVNGSKRRVQSCIRF